MIEASTDCMTRAETAVRASLLAVFPSHPDQAIEQDVQAGGNQTIGRTRNPYRRRISEVIAACKGTIFMWEVGTAYM